jgi:hypothetical protein
MLELQTQQVGIIKAGSAPYLSLRSSPLSAQQQTCQQQTYDLLRGSTTQAPAGSRINAAARRNGNESFWEHWENMGKVQQVIS